MPKITIEEFMASTRASSKRAFQLRFEYRPDYLYILVKSERIDFESALSIWQEIAEECGKSGYQKILIDRDVPKLLPEADLFWLRSELPKMGLRNFLIAIADYHEENYKLNRFADTVSNNRGVSTGTFTTVKAAEQWLSGK